jgi:cystathionine beta-lyase
MTFNFDRPPDRRGTDSQKWQKYAGKEILPMWVADMDFETSPAIVEALQRRVSHGIFGYARPVPSTVDAVVEEMSRRHRWKVDPAWIVWLPGLVCGLNVASLAFADPGDEILSLSPIYPPFTTGPKNQARVPKSVPLELNAYEPIWDINWKTLEAALTPRTKVLFFCHPHNPVSRIWSKEELARAAEFCIRNNLVLVSDEIHCDILLQPGAVHIPMGIAAPEAASRTVTLMSPSKMYNIPGLGAAFAIIPDPGLRMRFAKASAGIMAEVNTLAYAALEAAYRGSAGWRDALIDYLRSNRDYLTEFLLREVPDIVLEAPVEATYLAWLNVKQLGLVSPVKHFETHGVGLSDGVPFGARPGTHVRLNFGCPRATLIEALERIKTAAGAR